MHYSDLNALLRSEPEAKRYFDTLPDYAREQIQTRSGGVNSFDSLRTFCVAMTDRQSGSLSHKGSASALHFYEPMSVPLSGCRAQKYALL